MERRSLINARYDNPYFELIRDYDEKTVKEECDYYTPLEYMFFSNAESRKVVCEYEGGELSKVIIITYPKY